MKRWNVGDVMTTHVVTVSEDASFKHIVEMLATSAVSAVPVVDEHDRVLGVVSEADLLHKLEFVPHTGQSHVQLLDRVRRRSARAKADADTARDLMTSPAVVIDRNSTIAVAAKAMDVHHVKRLPVVDDEGRLVGIIARRDLLRVFLRGDDAIRSEIIDDVLVRTLWIEPDALTVAVADGVVSLSGTVDRRSTVGVIRRMVEHVPGVVEVSDHLTYHYDDSADLRHRRGIADVAG